MQDEDAIVIQQGEEYVSDFPFPSLSICPSVPRMAERTVSNITAVHKDMAPPEKAIPGIYVGTQELDRFSKERLAHLWLDQFTIEGCYTITFSLKGERHHIGILNPVSQCLCVKKRPKFNNHDADVGSG